MFNILHHIFLQIMYYLWYTSIQDYLKKKKKRNICMIIFINLIYIAVFV